MKRYISFILASFFLLLLSSASQSYAMDFGWLTRFASFMMDKKTVPTPTAYNLNPSDYKWAQEINAENLPATQTPAVKAIEWGKIRVVQNENSDNAIESEYRDCVLLPSGSRSWDWGKSNTHHKPGIQIAAIAEFIDDVDIVILTHGMQGVLEVPQATIDYIEKTKNKICLHGQTIAMVERYNKLVLEGKKVGALIHSTC